MSEMGSTQNAEFGANETCPSLCVERSHPGREHDPATDGCYCWELCAMGPACPGANAGLPRGCHRVQAQDGIDVLRRAARQIRNDRGGVVSRSTQDGRRWLPVADWLDTAGADLWAHGPLCCAEGCEACDDSLWMPHVRRALTVAHAYLGEEADRG